MFRKHALAPQEGRTFSNKALIALILPLIAEQLLAVMVGMADTAMVSGVGESAVAAVSTVDSLNVMFIQLFAAMSAGGAVVSAQYLGKGDKQSACRAAKQLMQGTVAIAVALALGIVIFHKQLMGLMDNGNDPAILSQSYTYLIITAISYPFLGIYNGGVGLLRAMGDSKTSMKTSILMNIINIVGNAIMIHPCGMGVAGAGTATLLSRIVSALVIMRVMYRQSMPIHLESLRGVKTWKGIREYFRFDFSMLRRIFKVGIPSGLENSLFQLGRVLIMSVVTTFSTPVRAANAVCNSITGLVITPGTAVSLAAVAVIGQLIGADKKEEARHYGKKLLAIQYSVTLLATSIVFIFAEPFVRLFNLSEEAVPVAVEIMRVYAIMAAALWASSFGLPNVLRAAGDVKFTMKVSILSMALLRLGACYLLVYVFHMSLMGVWVAMYMDWAMRTGFFVARFISGKWLHKKVI